jgi:hypothetical protein
LTKGDNFFCLCKDISTTEDTARVSWLRDDEVFKNSRLFHEEELYLRNITAEDGGIYTCSVRTDTMIDEINLEVFVHPGRYTSSCGNKKA